MFDYPLLWLEVDLDAIASNLKEIRRITRPGTRLMVVVKANAYGHGLVEVAGEAIANGANALGVARVQEAIVLRKAGFTIPVLIFGFTPFSFASDLIESDLTQTVFSYNMASFFSRFATKQGKKITVHIKIDTGMGRLGLLAGSPTTYSHAKERSENVIREIESIAGLSGLEVEGIYTHFATADSPDKFYAKKQFEIFLDFLNRLRRRGVEFPVKHAANSAALVEMPETHLDMVRSGIMVYGLYYSEAMGRNHLEIKPAMALKARVIHLKKVPSGFKISYGATYETKKPTTIATVPVGYADGLNRLLSSRGNMLVRGRLAPIAGRVCMDHSMLDVGSVSGVKLGDEVVIFGKQGNLSISVDKIASTINTINYEVLTSIPAGLPRLFVRKR